MRIKAKDPRLVSLMGEFMRVCLPCVRNRDAVRDYFLLSLLYESGARINEVQSLWILDIKETSNGEADVHFYGKGKKHWITPLSREIWV